MAKQRYMIIVGIVCIVALILSGVSMSSTTPRQEIKSPSIEETTIPMHRVTLNLLDGESSTHEPLAPPIVGYYPEGEAFTILGPYIEGRISDADGLRGIMGDSDIEGSIYYAKGEMPQPYIDLGSQTEFELDTYLEERLALEEEVRNLRIYLVTLSVGAAICVIAILVSAQIIARYHKRIVLEFVEREYYVSMEVLNRELKEYRKKKKR